MTSSNHYRPIWRPYTQEKTAAAPCEIVSARGAYLYPRSGQPIFDGTSSWWLITHGHCQPEIVEAVQQQAARLDQVLFANFSHQPADQLAERLMQITPPELTRVFLTDNGSTAVEAALKMAMQACAQQGRPAKQKFLALQGGYHGDTVGAMSVSGESAFNRPYKPSLFEVWRSRHPCKSTAPAEQFTEHFTELIERHHHKLAGVIIEPLVQGAGGMIMWPRDAVRQIARLCRKHNVYLIFDEIMTGFGRTGTLFAMDQVGVVPDLLCLSKGLTGGTLPLAVTLAREEIYQAFHHEDKGRMFFHGHSFTGNPLACAAAVANIRLLTNPESVASRTRIEDIHRTQIQKLSHIPHIGDPRVCGTIAAFDLNSEGYLSGLSSRITRLALDHGLFIRPLGSTVYLMPPYCTQVHELKSVWSTLTAILNQL